MIPLSKAHRRGIATALLCLDEALCRFEEWANGREVHSVLYHERNRLSGEQRNGLLSEIARTKAMIGDLCRSLRLETDARDVAMEIWAHASALRQMIMEIDGRHLRRYGEMPDDAAQHLDVRSAELLQGINRVVGFLSDTSHESV